MANRPESEVKMETKKNTRKNRLSPSLKKRKEKRFNELEIGDCCIDASNDLLIKSDEDQRAVSLISGIIYNDFCDCYVIPVDVKINWAKPKD